MFIVGRIGKISSITTKRSPLVEGACMPLTKNATQWECASQQKLTKIFVTLQIFVLSMSKLKRRVNHTYVV